LFLGTTLTPVNILTFDIEEWFHILDNPFTTHKSQWSQFESRIHYNVDRLLELLVKENKKATFFILGWIAEKYPDIVKKINELGYEIGSHSNNHKLLYQQSREQIIDDLRDAIKQLEDITGKRVYAYRAPGFSLTERNSWVFEILAEHKIEIDCSIFPTSRAHGGFKGFSSKPCLVEVNGVRIKEFPINVWGVGGISFVFSGGGYFRLLPYPLIKKLMMKSEYVMTYFHPRDFDPYQPSIKRLNFLRKFKSYYGLSTSFGKLKKLLNDFEFTDLSHADRLINWNQSDTIKLS
jgi:polysaccharide deacetylase family protein (PEP-CTERM system associated)